MQERDKRDEIEEIQATGITEVQGHKIEEI